MTDDPVFSDWREDGKLRLVAQVELFENAREAAHRLHLFLGELVDVDHERTRQFDSINLNGVLLIDGLTDAPLYWLGHFLVGVDGPWREPGIGFLSGL